MRIKRGQTFADHRKRPPGRGQGNRIDVECGHDLSQWQRRVFGKGLCPQQADFLCRCGNKVDIAIKLRSADQPPRDFGHHRNAAGVVYRAIADLVLGRGLCAPPEVIPMRHQHNRAQFGPLTRQFANDIVGLDPGFAGGRLQRDRQIECSCGKIRRSGLGLQFLEIKPGPGQHPVQRFGRYERFQIAAKLVAGQGITNPAAARGDIFKAAFAIKHGQHGRGSGLDQRVLTLRIVLPAIKQQCDPSGQFSARRYHRAGADKQDRRVFHQPAIARGQHQHGASGGVEPLALAREKGPAGVRFACDQADRREPWMGRIVGARLQTDIEPLLADIAQGLGLTLGARFAALIGIAGQFGDVRAQLAFQLDPRLVRLGSGERMNRQGGGKQQRHQAVHRLPETFHRRQLTIN